MTGTSEAGGRERIAFHLSVQWVSFSQLIFEIPTETEKDQLLQGPALTCTGSAGGEFQSGKSVFFLMKRSQAPSGVDVGESGSYRGIMCHMFLPEILLIIISPTHLLLIHCAKPYYKNQYRMIVQ